MRRRKKIFWGIFLLTAAVLLTAGNFLDIPVSDILIMLSMAIFFVEGIIHRNFALILFPIAIGVILNSERFGMENIKPWSILLAALFGSIGLTVLFPGKKWKKWGSMHVYRDRGSHADGWSVVEDAKETAKGRTESEVSGESEASESSGDSTGSPKGSESGEIRFDNSFGNTVKYITCRALREVWLENSFGNMVVYFNNVDLKEHTAYIRAATSFGNIVLHIPASWKTVIRSNTVFAQIVEEGKCNPDGENVLYIMGEVAFGDIRVRYI